jgi:hypothetical protein
MAANEKESTHTVQFYEKEADLVPSLVKYVGTALRLGHDAVVIARPSLAGKLSAELHREHVQRLSSERPRGQLTTLDAQQALDMFMIDGWPDSAAFDQHIASVMSKATAGGKTAVAYGEMVALLCEQGQYAAALRLEKVWNDVLGRMHFSLLCSYPMRLFSNMAGKNSYSHICAAHQHVVRP